MIPADDEERFRAYLERTVPYAAAIREAGDLPWWEDPERSARVAAHVGLPADAPAEDLRRALFFHHHQDTNTREALPA